MPGLFRRLLLATEHGEFDAGAETLAFALARRDATPLRAVLPIVSNAELEAEVPLEAARVDAQAAARRAGLQRAAQAAGVDLDLNVRHGAEPDAEIVAEARECDADLIVIRRRGRRGFLAQLLVGEMVGRVVADAPCSVLIAPRGAQPWTRGVLVGVDVSAPDPALLDAAAGVARDGALPLHLLAVVGQERLRAEAAQALEALLTPLRAAGVVADAAVRVGRVHEELLAGAQAAGADLLVIGRHRAGFPRSDIGSTAHRVIGLSGGPVLVHVSPSSHPQASP